MQAPRQPFRFGPDCSGRIYLLQDGVWTLTDEAATFREGDYGVDQELFQAALDAVGGPDE